MRKFLLLSITLFFCLISVNVNGQHGTLTGKVTETGGQPLVGATVAVKGSNNGASADGNGNYTLSRISPRDTLVVSYIGKEPQTAVVGNRSVLNFQLQESANVLDEVVVIGYGTARRGNLTGAVATLSSDDILKTPTNTVGEAMAGKLAGVQVITADGAPDADVQIFIRGRNSITQSSEPLYIVDGFPVESMAGISANDIADISVQKDAASTAIYGSRGANGVVMITTRTATNREGKLSVSVNSYGGLKRIAPTPEVLNPYEYALWQYEQSVYRKETSLRYEPYFGVFGDIGLYQGYAGNNWKDIVFGQTGTTLNNNITLSGRTDKMNYTASVTSLIDNAIMITSGYKRENVMFKFQHRPNRNLTLNFNARYSATHVTGSGTNEQSGGRAGDTRMKYVMQYSPIPLHNLTLNGDLDDMDFYNESGLFTPTQYVRDNDRVQELQNFNISGNLVWTIVKGMTFNSTVTMSHDRNEDDRYFGVTTYYARRNSPVKDHPAVGIINTDKSRIYNSNTLTYDISTLLPKNHSLSLMLGEETSVTKAQVLTTNVDGYPLEFTSSQAFKFTSLGVPTSTNNFYSAPDKLLSFFGRASYNYHNRYIVEATMRADASTKFTVPSGGAVNNLWGYFPSISAAWRILEEDFMASSRSWLSNLKLRASYGMSGNDNIPSGQTLQEFVSNTTTILPWDATVPWIGSGNYMTNPNLKWETTTSRNVAVDFGFFDQRLSGSVDLYLNTTDDLLIRFPVRGVGYTDRYSNIGTTQNKGIEITLNGVILKSKNFDLSASFNVAMNRNKVVSLGGLEQIQAYAGWASTQIDYDFLVREGMPLGQIYGYIVDGRYSPDEFTWSGTSWVANEGVIDNKLFAGSSWGPGAIKFRNLGGDPLTITQADDRTVIGCTLPLATGGFSLSGRVYDFDFNANFNFSYGNDVLNVNKAEYTSTAGYRYQNLLTAMDSSHRWNGIDSNGQIVTDTELLKQMNATTTMWNPLTAYRFASTYIVEDGSFLRLNSMTVGYTLPKSASKKLGIENLRFYVTGSNLLLLTNYTGFDPEADTRRSTPLTPGVDYSPYPRTRGFILGVNLNF